MTLPVQNETYTFYTALVSQANPAEFQVNPTIATGDFQVSIDGGALANLTSLPTAIPAGSFILQVNLTAAEMAGAKVSVIGVDASGAEWDQTMVFIDVPAGSIDSLYALEVGDRIETANRLIVNEAGTSTAILDKSITGSLLNPAVTLTTLDT